MMRMKMMRRVRVMLTRRVVWVMVRRKMRMMRMRMMRRVRMMIKRRMLMIRLRMREVWVMVRRKMGIMRRVRRITSRKNGFLSSYFSFMS